MQPLFFMPNIQEKIINFDVDEKFTQLQIDDSKMDQNDKIKLKASKMMVKYVQRLFSQLLISNVAYQDPTCVLENIVDEHGHKIPIYEQKDIGEFFTIFLERLQDGLGENKAMIKKLMGEDLAKTMVNTDLLGMSQQCTTIKVSSIVSDYIMMPSKPVENSNEIPAEGKTNSDKIDSLFEFSDQQVETQIIPDNYKSGISMMDPTKASILVNYDLDAFRNSIWENFLGSQIEYVKLVEQDGT
jgi:hypothetical protein